MFAEGAFEPNCVLYLRNCANCDYTVLVHCAKVMIEGCTGCRITLHGKVITSTAEVWKCEDTELICNSKVALQTDLCKGLRVKYAKAADMPQLVWAGMEDFRVEFADGAHEPLVTGLEQKRKEYDGDVNAELDQFIVRDIDGKLLEERIVRLANGFPTTDREADAWDADQARKEAHLEAMARKLIKENPGLVAGTAKKKPQQTKVRDAKKLKPNEPCHCKSGKKYKKCHMEADERERLEAKNKVPASERKPRMDQELNEKIQNSDGGK